MPVFLTAGIDIETHLYSKVMWLVPALIWVQILQVLAEVGTGAGGTSASMGGFDDFYDVTHTNTMVQYSRICMRVRFCVCAGGGGHFCKLHSKCILCRSPYLARLEQQQHFWKRVVRTKLLSQSHKNRILPRHQLQLSKEKATLHSKSHRINRYWRLQQI